MKSIACLDTMQYSRLVYTGMVYTLQSDCKIIESCLNYIILQSLCSAYYTMSGTFMLKDKLILLYVAWATL